MKCKQKSKVRVGDMYTSSKHASRDMYASSKHANRDMYASSKHANIGTFHILYFIYLIYYCMFICPFSIFICEEGENMKRPPISAFFSQPLMSVSSFCQDSSLDFSFRLAFDNQISLGCRRASIFSVLVWIYQKLVKIKVPRT